MQRKTLATLAAVLLAGACTLPAFAQDTPAQTNLDSSSANKEARNARGSQLTDVTPEQAHANELRRCDALPPFYKDDCVARVNGQGDNTVQGSVAGGGILVETTTTLPESQLKQIESEPGQTQIKLSGVPDNDEQVAAPAAHKHHKHPAHHKAKKKPAKSAEPQQ